MDLSKIIQASVAKAQANPNYLITPKHATVIEYRIQEWLTPEEDTCEIGGWVDTSWSSEGLKGFSDLKKRINEFVTNGANPQRFRIIAIGEVS